MKRIIFILAFAFTAFLVLAQNSAEAKALLDKTYNSYISSGGIKLTFNTAYIGADGKEQGSQKGEAFIKGDKFRLEMDEMNVWFDGKTQWVLMKDIEEVNVSNPTNNELASISPLALLGIYKEGYVLDAPVKDTIDGLEVSVIKMTPTKNNNDFKSISVAIDSSRNSIIQVTLTMQNNTQNRINITNYNSNYKFADNEFSFNIADYPGVEVVDLR